ncbi:serine hydrolase domain-containing protein [Dinghuibacter silviterrae]|uniref:CubicO group peptidase (Beta-lactamase class C family) n=1 Tax=Dinghuibacter silviterrae TaxID=1539049 RepID=A0A4R8DH15_9BACT|nr:serine hydrolase [Dinghuibacter silviterrae]TDW96991.1 CubicO group peptidase (beta-lactamase class C family) [Dinghuibacter silviterrae]
MRKLITLLICSILSTAAGAQKTSKKEPFYFPPKGAWETRSPESLKVDTTKIKDAIQAAKANETKDSRDLAVAQVQDFWKEPYLEAEGAFGERGDPTGIIVYKGYIIAIWGDPTQVEMTNSVTKSFLSTVIGVAVDKGLIKSVLDTIAPYMAPIELFQPQGGPPLGAQPQLLYPFATPHNRFLTWDVMLRQTSDWEGTLWGKPDWADRPEATANAALQRERHAPGTVWKYNDVRVNALALAATNVWRKPLPQVLKTYVMDPIGASDTWRWMGYRNAWIVIDGQPVQSVSGGGHWGGGMFINAYDMARFGLLTLNRGKWNGQQLVSDTWVMQALTPTTANKGYGYMNWFLNGDQKLFPSAPKTAFAHIGNGQNVIYVDPEHDLVIVARWITGKGMDTVIRNVLAALPR